MWAGRASLLEKKPCYPTPSQFPLLPFEHMRVQRVKEGRTKWERSFSTRNGGLSILVKSKYKKLVDGCIFNQPSYVDGITTARIMVRDDSIGSIISVVLVFACSWVAHDSQFVRNKRKQDCTRGGALEVSR